MRNLIFILFSISFYSLNAQQVETGFHRSAFEKLSENLTTEDKAFIKNLWDVNTQGWFFYKHTRNQYFKSIFESNNERLYDFLLDNQLILSFEYLSKHLTEIEIDQIKYLEFWAERISNKSLASAKEYFKNSFSSRGESYSYSKLNSLKAMLKVEEETTTNKEYYYFLKFLSNTYGCPIDGIQGPFYIEDIQHQLKNISDSRSPGLNREQDDTLRNIKALLENLE